MSDEDEPAPSPSAAVVARRASRIAKSLREESGCEEDTSSDDEWDPAQEQDEEDEEDEQDERNQGLADASTYGRSRLHEMPRAREDGTGEEMRNALFGKRLGRRTVHLHGLAPSGDAAFEERQIHERASRSNVDGVSAMHRQARFGKAGSEKTPPLVV